MKKVWNVNVDGVNYCVEYTAGAFSKKLAVNGVETKVKSQNYFIMMIDMPVMLGAKQAQFVVIGSKADLVIDGMYLDQQKPYVPLHAIPTYAYVFLGMAFIINAILSGMLGAVIGILFGVQIIKTSIRIREDGKGNIGACIGLLILSIAITLVIGIGVGLLLA